MPSALSIIGAITLVGAGAAGGLAWDRHAPIGWHAHVLFWNPGFDLPPSLAQRLATAEDAARQALADKKQCLVNLDGQNQDIARTAELDSKTLAAAAADLAATRLEVAGLRRSSATLKAYAPKGADRCARWDDADRIVLMMLGTK